LQKENETFVPCDHQGGETELAFNSMSHELAGTSGGGADHKACRGVKVTRQVEVSDALIAVLKDLRRPHWQASVWRMVVLERLDELPAFAKKVAKTKNHERVHKSGCCRMSASPSSPRLHFVRRGQ
jgi:hypothetical protein